LGEIEAALSEHPAVRQAVVVFQDAKNRGEAGDPRLVAFVVPRDEDQLPLDELRDHLLAALPAYMVPAVFVPLRTLPLTPNGKVDRRALPLPEQAGAGTRRGYVPPRDLFELRLIRLWEEVLNVHPIGARDDFFELGGHSLLAVRLVALLQRDFGRSIPLLTLFQNPTIENLAAIVRQTTGKTSLSCVVPLRARGTRPPWFFVHPSGGSVHWYLDLARHLDTDQPFYGLQALGVEGEAELDTRIEDMAARYIAAMRMVQPTGPYYLGSWSMGVIIAFEMAQQLRAQGQSVGLLALIDQGPFPPGPEPPDDAAYLCDLFDQHVEVSVEELRRLSFDEQVACILDRGRRTGWIYPDVTFEQFRGLIWIMKTEMQAWRRYVPSTYPGQITFFQAANPAGHTLAPRRASTLANDMVRRLGGRGAGLLRLLERLETGQSASAEPPDLNGVQQTDMGWSQLAAGVAIHVVPGDHLSLMHEPCVATLAEQLNHLRQA
jgi:thioesterase domain-containing protein/acyl carrier protein